MSKRLCQGQPTCKVVHVVGGVGTCACDRVAEALVGARTLLPAACSVQAIATHCKSNADGKYDATVRVTEGL